MSAISQRVETKSALSDFSDEIEKLKTELHEIDLLVRQTGAEIDRFSLRQAETSAHLRQVEANFDSFAREDIKQAYSSDRDAQLKLAMMRIQLEQFQNKQKYLDRFIQLLHRTSEITTQAQAQMRAEVSHRPSSQRSDSDRDSVLQAIEAQEVERQRLAQQMHDGPAQTLTNLILQAEIVDRLFEKNPQRARAEIANLKSSAAVTFQRVRDFIFALRPMMLDDLGLIPTLRRYLQTVEQKNKLPVTLTLKGDRTLASYVQVTVFRAVQELTTNVAQHAHATRALVNVDLDAEPIVIDVEDDGCGFNAAQVLAKARARGTPGLVTLEKRLEMIGGSIKYDSTEGHGSHIHVLIPSS